MSAETSGHTHDLGLEWADVEGRLWQTCAWCNADFPVRYMKPPRPSGSIYQLSGGRLREDPITCRVFLSGRDPGDEG